MKGGKLQRADTTKRRIVLCNKETGTKVVKDKIIIEKRTRERERERVFNIERIILLIVDANRDLSEQWPSHDRVK
jgi:hypothetical protein